MSNVQEVSVFVGDLVNDIELFELGRGGSGRYNMLANVEETIELFFNDSLYGIEFTVKVLMYSRHETGDHYIEVSAIHNGSRYTARAFERLTDREVPTYRILLRDDVELLVSLLDTE